MNVTWKDARIQKGNSGPTPAPANTSPVIP